MEYNNIENKIKQELQNQSIDWDKDAMWNDLEQHLPTATKTPWWRKYLPLALIALVTIGGSLIGYNLLSSNDTLDTSALNNKQNSIAIEKQSILAENKKQISKQNNQSKIEQEETNKTKSEKAASKKVDSNKNVVKNSSETKIVDQKENTEKKANQIETTIDRKLAKTKTSNTSKSNKVVKSKVVNTIIDNNVPQAKQVESFKPQTKQKSPTVLSINVFDEKNNNYNSGLIKNNIVKTIEKENTMQSNVVNQINNSVVVSTPLNTKKDNFKNTVAVLSANEVIQRLTLKQAKAIEANTELNVTINTDEREFDFPVIKPKAVKQNKFSAEIYSGVGYTNRNLSNLSNDSTSVLNPFSANEDQLISKAELLNLKNTNEKMMENTKVGLRFSYQLNKHLKISTGIERQQFNEQFNYQDSHTVTTFIESEEASYYEVDGVRQYFPGTLWQENTLNRNVTLYNKHIQYNIPIQLGFTFGNKVLQNEVYAGFGLNVNNSSTDKFLQYAFPDRTDLYLTNGVNNIHAGFKTAYSIGDKFQITAGIQFDNMINYIINTDDLFRTKYQLIGVQTGIRAKF